MMWGGFRRANASSMRSPSSSAAARSRPSGWVADSCAAGKREARWGLNLTESLTTTTSRLNQAPHAQLPRAHQGTIIIGGAHVCGQFWAISSRSTGAHTLSLRTVLSCIGGSQWVQSRGAHLARRDDLARMAPRASHLSSDRPMQTTESLIPVEAIQFFLRAMKPHCSEGPHLSCCVGLARLERSR